jgi:hypothetical protein
VDLSDLSSALRAIDALAERVIVQNVSNDVKGGPSDRHGAPAIRLSKSLLALDHGTVCRRPILWAGAQHYRLECTLRVVAISTRRGFKGPGSVMSSS